MANSELPRIIDMKIRDIPPFTDAVELQFDDEVNLFIGPNGTGKSTILRLLAPKFPAFGIPGFRQEGVDIGVRNWPHTPAGLPDDNAVPQVHFPPIRTGMPISHPNVRVYQIHRDRNTWHRIMSDDYNYFDGSRVYDAMQMLYQEDLKSPSNRTRGASVAYDVHLCVREICREVITGRYPKNIRTFEKLDEAEANLSGLPEELLYQPIEHYAMGIDTMEGSNEPLYIGELSTGTQGLFLWIWYMALTMARMYEFTSDWQKQAGIIFIDEIENHLHPSWQRRVIPALRKHFPGLQIFATTHSPFVVAGLKKGQVHRLYRENEGIRALKLNEHEREQRIVGWTTEEILREFMGIDDPTDEETAASAAVLRWLRTQHPTDGLAEAWRQEKMKQLRESTERTADESIALFWLEEQGRLEGQAEGWWERQVERLQVVVSPDLLEGGPIAAQRERFLEQLSEMLKVDTEGSESTNGADDSQD